MGRDAKRGARGADGRGHAKPKASISVVGAGRLGAALAIALERRGYTVEALVARRLSSARRAARLLNSNPLTLATTQLDRLPASDILFITTPDDEIETTAARLAAILKGGGAGGDVRNARVALHTSGALSSDVLKALKGAGFSTGSLHPLLSVSDPVKGAESFGSAFFCVEGKAKALSAARSLVRSLGARSFSVSTKDKALYHAAAVITSGHTTALFDVATEMLGRCGLGEPRARAVLLPLLKSTLDNLYTSNAAQALTGTFRRADAATVRRHISALRSSGLNDALAAYALLGRRSLKLARAAGADAKAIKEIELVLEEAVGGRVK